MAVTGIHHVQLNVRDIDEAVAFYVERLGFTKADMPDFNAPIAWLNAGENQLHLVQGTTPDNHGQHVALQIEDLDTSIEDLQRHGIEVSDVLQFGTRRQAVVIDPSGNKIEINEVVTAPVS